MNTENVLKVYRRADAIDRSEGLLAYSRYNAMLSEMADAYGTSTDCACAVFAALSPVNDYIGNLRSTVSVFECKKQGRSPQEIVATTFTKNRIKAWRLANGEEPLSVLSGRKVLNFYHNLRNPLDPVPVTIDRHALSITRGNRDDNGRGMTDATYDLIAATYRTAAEVLGVLANQLQATTWFAWKRINNVLYDPQLDLFQNGNQWRAQIAFRDIKPFPFNLNKNTK